VWLAAGKGDAGGAGAARGGAWPAGNSRGYPGRVPTRDAAALHPRPDYGRGIFRRRIELQGTQTSVEGDLEDDFHRFGVRLEHDGRQVVRIAGVARRHPWATCPGALSPLERLAGMPLAAASSAVRRWTDPRAQCTHLLDLAGLAVAHAAAGRARRGYEVEIPDRVAGRSRARLARDGAALLEFEIEHGVIVYPEPFAGQASFGGGFGRWAEANLEPDLAEAAIVLQRACGIAMGRQWDMDQVPGAWVFGALTGGACHTFGARVVEDAARVLGSQRDFTDAPERLLAVEEAPDESP
jgi:hypothetical protein